MKLNPFSAVSLIGLDVQPASLHLVQMKKTARGFLIERAAVMDLHINIFAEGKIKHWDELHLALTDLVSTHGIKGMPTAIHLPSHLVRLQQIQVPKGLSDAEIEAEVYARIQQDLPGMTDILSIDYAESPQPMTDYSNLFFVAVRKEYLFQYLECLRATGLKIKIVDIDIYALKRAICFAWHAFLVEPSVNAILSIIDGMARLIIFDAEYILFHQCWDITETADLSTQLRTRIQLFLAMFDEVKIQNLILCDHKNSTKFDDLMWEFAFKIHYLDVFSRIKFLSSDAAGLIRSRANNFVIAAGLAMREVPIW